MDSSGCWQTQLQLVVLVTVATKLLQSEILTRRLTRGATMKRLEPLYFAIGGTYYIQCEKPSLDLFHGKLALSDSSFLWVSISCEFDFL